MTSPSLDEMKKTHAWFRKPGSFDLTTNVDHCFPKAGFDKNRIFYTQGDYGLFQCSEPGHKETYDDEDTIKKMVISQGFQIKGVCEQSE